LVSMSGSDDEDFSAFKTPGGKDAFKQGKEGSSPNEVAMGEEGVSGIVLCGYLYKSGSGLMGRWNRRWVTLTKRSLCLFNDRQDSHPKTVVKLKGIKEIAISKKTVLTATGMQEAFAFKITPGDGDKITLDASNDKNRRLWMDHLKQTVSDAKDRDDDDDGPDEAAVPQGGAGKAMTAREQAMEEEKREAKERLKAKRDLEKANPGMADAKWAAFTSDIQADAKEEAGDGAPTRKMTFSGKSLKRLQLVAKAVDAEEGGQNNLPAYMRAGMKKGGAMDDELDNLGNGDLEEDPWDELENEDPPVLPRARLARAKKLFFAYDFDHSGRIDFEEFYALIKKFDERIQPQGVRKTFEKVGANDLEFTPKYFVAWFNMVFGKAPEEAFEAGMNMLMECATAETLLGEAEALRHTLRVKWHFRVGEVLNREWCPELTFEEATKQDSESDKKLRRVIMGLWGGGVSDVLERLTSGGQEVEHNNDEDICEELIFCAMENKVEQAEILLDAGASPNFVGSDQRTPLITASAEGHADMVSLLLQYGADATKTSKSGNTALDYSKFYDHTAVAEVLSDPYLYRGSTCTNPLFETKRKDGSPALFLSFLSEVPEAKK